MAKLLLSVVTIFVAVAEFVSNQCIVWVLGQDEMPDELID